MADIKPQPIILRDCELTFDSGDDYAGFASKIELVPSTTLVEWTGLHPDATYQFPGKTKWQLNLEYAQDWESPKSLSRFLWANRNRGVPIPCKIKTRRGEGLPAWLCDVVVTPGAAGGAVGAISVASVSLGVSGEPRLDSDDNASTTEPVAP